MRARSVRPSVTPRSVGDLLARTLPALTRHSPAAPDSWEAWLRERLAPELATRVRGVIANDSELVLLTESAAWAARLRYVVADLEAAIRERSPDITSVAVRVSPRTTRSGRGR